jgi:hypothetical protein
MGRRSSVKDLDPRIKAEVDAALRDDRLTIDEIVALIREAGGDVSRSAVGRYKQTFEQGMEVYRASQQMAQAWGKRMEEEPEGSTAQLARSVLGSVALHTGQAMMQSGDAMPAGEVMFLAKALDHLSRAELSDTQRILRIRQEVAKAASVVAAKEVKAAGLSDAAAEAIRQKILGVAA